MTNGHPGTARATTAGMNVDLEHADEIEHPLTVEQGGGPPIGTAWTFIVVVDGGEDWSADLEHAAPLPRIGDRVDFIAANGRQTHYRVTEVIHTLQPSASDRPLVRSETSSPNTIVTDGTMAGPPHTVRAGLPRVIAVPEED